MPRRKRKRISLMGFFTAIGGGVIRTGKSAKKAVGIAKISKPVMKGDEISRRLGEIKRLEMILEEELREEMKLREEEEKWEERVELKRPLSERLSEVFYKVLKSPAQRLATSLGGLSQDLYRANIKIDPEKFAAYIIGIGMVVTAFTVVLMFLMKLSPVFILLGGFLAFVFSFMFGKSYPKRKARARTTDVNRLIPYAMRHMATQLSSGIGLPETMVSVSRAKYGALSEEFGRAITDMNAGMSMEEALAAMDARVNSEALRRAIRQINRTLRTGGDLSRTLDVVASETAFEMRSKLRDYVQKLNMFTLIYMFLSAVVPAMLMVVVMIAAGRGGGGMTPEKMGIFYLLLLPFLLVYFVFMMKRAEPRL
jgi:flagellar protein FlaJ